MTAPCRIRDSDQSKVYDGEDQVALMLSRANALGANPCVTLAGSTVTLPVERKFADLASVQNYCDRVIAHLNAGGRNVPPVRVRVRKGQTKAIYERGTIAVPMVERWALREMVVLHELAHHLAPASEMHGPVFRDTFAGLASDVMGPEVGFSLRVCWAGLGL